MTVLLLGQRGTADPVSTPVFLALMGLLASVFLITFIAAGSIARYLREHRGDRGMGHAASNTDERWLIFLALRLTPAVGLLFVAVACVARLASES